MSPSLAIALVLCIATVAASLRRALRWRRLSAQDRPRAGRLAAILLMQVACAALLFATLLPPGRSIHASRLVVMTANADADDAHLATRADAILIALPEAGADVATAAGARAMPDLATALRMHPAAGSLHVLGAGLEARDLDAARSLPVTFEPPPLPPGLVELQAPARVVSGGVLRVSGRMHEAADARVELLDPAGTVQYRAIPDEDGRFQLQALVRASGPAVYGLRLRGQVEAEADIPVDARPGDPARLLLLAGAPGPEPKYLRRWASDAGLQLHSRMALGGGATLGDAPLAFDAETLSDFDLLIVDERAWAGLDASARNEVLAAVDQGLGLMLRITGSPDAATRDALRQLGFALGDADPALEADVLLDAARSADTGDAATASAADPDIGGMGVPALVRQPHPILAPGSVSLLDDASGASLARWRPSGRGRIAVWNLDHSFRLVLTGHGQRHARLWSEATGTLARAGARRQPRFEGIARAGRRVALCDFEPGTVLLTGDDTRTHPLHDPASAGCAAVWPTRSGWYRVGEGEAAPLLYVHPADALPGLAAQERQEATLQLARATTPKPRPGHADDAASTYRFGGRAVNGGAFAFDGGSSGTGARWPWFLAWLLAAGLLWWLERTTHRIRDPAPRA